MTMASDIKPPAVFLTPEFIRDIQESKHPNLAKQVFGHTFDSNGVFNTSGDDHPYDGMADAWIRWVQMGGPGLRLIYIRKGSNVYLYRAVGKSDEGGLTDPKVLATSAAVEGLPKDVIAALGESAEAIANRLLKTTKPTYLREAVRSMFHLAHREVLLVSPTVSPPLFRVNGELGRFLDRAVEEGTRCALVTSTPGLSDLELFDDLARRNIEVYFIQNLKSRLFLFDVNEYQSPKDANPSSTVMMGSAELTHHSLGVGDVGRNEELCYRFPETHFGAFKTYADSLVTSAIDLQGHKIKLGQLEK
jgi:hypothetical protein